MFKTKFIISTIIFVTFLIVTSAVKKITNLTNDILIKKKDISETQLDFYYLSSPKEIEKKLNLIGFDNYQPISHSKIFLDVSDFSNLDRKTSNLKKFK